MFSWHFPSSLLGRQMWVVWGKLSLFAIVNMVSKYKWCNITTATSYARLKLGVSQPQAMQFPFSSCVVHAPFRSCVLNSQRWPWFGADIFLVDLGIMQECFFVLICASCGLKECGSRNCAAKCCNASKVLVRCSSLTQAQAKQPLKSWFYRLSKQSPS